MFNLNFTIYHNQKLIKTLTFDIVVPNEKAQASWDNIDNNGGYPIPESVYSLKYNENSDDYYVIGGESNSYNYDLNVTTNQKALDHNGTNVAIPIASHFHVDNVLGYQNHDGLFGNLLENNKDFSFGISNGILTINIPNSIHDSSRLNNYDSNTNFKFKIVGHYDENTTSKTIIDFPEGKTTVSSNDGSGVTTNQPINGIGGKILSTGSLEHLEPGALYAPNIDASVNHTRDLYYLDSKNNQAIYFTGYLRNRSQIALNNVPFEIELPVEFTAQDVKTNNSTVKITSYTYTDGSTSNSFDITKQLAKISGTVELNKAGQNNSDLTVEVFGKLTPDTKVTVGQKIYGHLLSGGSDLTSAVKFVNMPAPDPIENDGSTSNTINFTSVGPKTNLGYVYGRINSLSDNTKSENVSYEVVIPANSKVSRVDYDKTIWNVPEIIKLEDGRTQYTFTMKSGLNVNKLTYSQKSAPYLYLSSADVYVPSLRKGTGYSQILFNNQVFITSNFSVNMLAAVADTLTTGIMGNKDLSSTMSATSDDHLTGKATFEYDLVNGNPDTQINDAIYIGNVIDTHDGKSQFNSHLTGPVNILDYSTKQNENKLATVYYSTKIVDIANAEVDNLPANYVTAEQVTDWSKIKSFKIVFNQPLLGGKIYEVIAPAFVENQPTNINKIGYLSSAVFAPNVKSFKVVAASVNSAQLTINGISTIHQKLHYVDADGKEQYIELPKNFDIQLKDQIDTFHVPTALDQNASQYVPQHYRWDQKAATIQNSDTQYPDELSNGVAQDNTIAKYDFDGDSIIWNLIADKQESFNVKETIHYKYLSNDKQAAPDYDKTTTATVYINPLTGKISELKLDNELPKVVSPELQSYIAQHGSFDGYGAIDYSVDSSSFPFKIDYTNKVASIDLTDYYVSSAAGLLVVDPNTHEVHLIETAFNDGSGDIKFKNTDQSLAKTGYKMHVYYTNNSGIYIPNTYSSQGYYKTARLIYPLYDVDGQTDMYVLTTSNKTGKNYNEFAGYNTLEEALADSYDGSQQNGKYDDQFDSTTDNSGENILAPTQSFIVFYTRDNREELNEQFAITADNDPFANANSKALNEFAIPKDVQDSLKNKLWSDSGKPGEFAFNHESESGVYNPLNGNGSSNISLDLIKNDPQFADLYKLLNNSDQISFPYNLLSRPGYYIDQLTFHTTDKNDNGINYIVKLHPYDELLKLNKQGQAKGKLVLTESSSVIQQLESIDEYGTPVYNENHVVDINDYAKVNDNTYQLDFYANIYGGNLMNALSGIVGAIPIIPGFALASDSSGARAIFDSTEHEPNTPDPHPQVLNLHYKKFDNGFTPYVGMQSNAKVIYKDVTNLPNNGEAYTMGGLNENGQFKEAPTYDLEKTDNSGALKTNLEHDDTNPDVYEDKGTVNFTFTYPTSNDSWNKMKNSDNPESWHTVDVGPYSKAIGSDYMIVQQDDITKSPQVINLYDQQSYATPDDPTGATNYAKAMFSIMNSSGNYDYPQRYYVYVKKIQKVNYQVLVENKDGQTIKTVTPTTAFGYGATDDIIANGKTNDNKSSLKDAYQSIVDDLANHGYTVVTKVNGNLKATDDINQVRFDNDSNVDQLLTIYVIQNKQVNVHYIDVNDSQKTSNYAPQDGVDLIAHLQSINGLAGTDYQNKLWDYTSAGYQLADNNIASGATSGSFTLNDPISRSYYVYLKHVTQPDSQTVTLKQTIHYVYENGQTAKPDHIVKTTFTRTGTKDLTTNTTAWNNWEPNDSYTFASVDSPEIVNYQPDIKTIDAEQIKPLWEDTEHTVVYKFVPHGESGIPLEDDKPQLNYGKPGDPLSYDLPKLNYGKPGDPLSYDLPKLNYGKPGDPLSYDLPKINYGKPGDPLSHDLPKLEYGKPGDPLSYDLPKLNYGKPGDPLSHDLPKLNYGKPGDPLSYDLPKLNYGKPGDPLSYDLPKLNYGKPGDPLSYDLPKLNYGKPGDPLSYDLPKLEYGKPGDPLSYDLPKLEYGKPGDPLSYDLPKLEYGKPGDPLSYDLPKLEYGKPGDPLSYDLPKYPIQPTIPVQPSDQPTIPVQPSDQPTTPVQPSDRPTIPVQPSDQPTTPVQPSDQPTMPVQPGDQSTTSVHQDNQLISIDNSNGLKNLQ